MSTADVLGKCSVAENHLAPTRSPRCDAYAFQHLATDHDDIVVTYGPDHERWADRSEPVFTPILADRVDETLRDAHLGWAIRPRQHDAENQLVDEQEHFPTTDTTRF